VKKWRGANVYEDELFSLVDVIRKGCIFIEMFCSSSLFPGRETGAKT
jgi:hypothetical protein